MFHEHILRNSSSFITLLRLIFCNFFADLLNIIFVKFQRFSYFATFKNSLNFRFSEVHHHSGSSQYDLTDADRPHQASGVNASGPYSKSF